MNKPVVAAVLVAIGLMSSHVMCAQHDLEFNLGLDAWQGSAKVDEVRRDSDVKPSFNMSVEHQHDWLPNARLRWSTIDSDFASFDKTDVSLYYNVLHHDLMEFDVGANVSTFSNSRYVKTDATDGGDFDERVFNWYADAIIRVPDSEWAVIGQFDFGNRNGIKMSDLTAGMQYQALKKEDFSLDLKAGYRVIDLDMSDAGNLTSDARVFVDGWFAGASFRF